SKSVDSPAVVASSAGLVPPGGAFPEPAAGSAVVLSRLAGLLLLAFPGGTVDERGLALPGAGSSSVGMGSSSAASPPAGASQAPVAPPGSGLVFSRLAGLAGLVGLAGDGPEVGRAGFFGAGVWPSTTGKVSSSLPGPVFAAGLPGGDAGF